VGEPSADDTLCSRSDVCPEVEHAVHIKKREITKGMNKLFMKPPWNMIENSVKTNQGNSKTLPEIRSFKLKNIVQMMRGVNCSVNSFIALW
jgi:hypothetical protein